MPCNNVCEDSCDCFGVDSGDAIREEVSGEYVHRRNNCGVAS